MGVSYGRLHCTRCGAEGVNRRTCTGDSESHGRLQKPYRQMLGTGNQSSYNSEDGKPYAKEYEYGNTAEDGTWIPDQDSEDTEVSDILEGEIVYTPPAVEYSKTEFHVVTFRVMTRFPLGLEATLMQAVNDDVHSLWIDTDFKELDL